MITLEYFAQAKQAAGRDCETFETTDADSIEAIIQLACDRHGEALRNVLQHDGRLAPWLLVSINGTAVQAASTTITDGDVVRLLSPISGG